MRVPAAFNKLGECFHQDIELDDYTLEEFVFHTLGRFGPEERTELKRFLTELVKPIHSGQELAKIMNDTPTDLYFMDGEEVRDFLKTCLSKLG